MPEFAVPVCWTKTCWETIYIEADAEWLAEEAVKGDCENVNADDLVFDDSDLQFEVGHAVRISGEGDSDAAQ